GVGDSLRQGLLDVWRVQALGRVVRDLTFSSKVLKERAQRGRLARDRGRGIATLGQMQEVPANALAVDRPDGDAAAALSGSLELEIVGELQQVVAIGRNRVRRQATLGTQIRQQGIDTLDHGRAVLHSRVDASNSPGTSPTADERTLARIV